MKIYLALQYEGEGVYVPLRAYPTEKEAEEYLKHRFPRTYDWDSDTREIDLIISPLIPSGTDKS